MTEITKSSPVTIIYKYKENRIDLFGDGIQGSLYISSNELKNMYWKGEGKGNIRIKLDQS